MPEPLIKDYMSTSLLTVDSQKTIRDAAQFMMDKGVRSLLVKEQDKVVGIVTKTDFILRVYVNENMNPDKDIVSDVMSKSLQSLDGETPMEEARRFMRKHKIGHLGVTRDGQLVGILSKKDLLTCFGRLD